MTAAKEMLLTDLDYSAWANQVLLEACSALTAEELGRDLGASHRSVIETLRHIYYTERVWVRRLRENAMPPMHEVGDQKLFCDPPPEPGLAELKRDWPEVWKAGHEWLENRAEADLDGLLSSRMPDGREFRLSR
jgi:DinB family protein